jgi:hypothetical protein
MIEYIAIVVSILLAINALKVAINIYTKIKIAKFIKENFTLMAGNEDVLNNMEFNKIMRNQFKKK